MSAFKAALSVNLKHWASPVTAKTRLRLSFIPRLIVIFSIPAKFDSCIWLGVRLITIIFAAKVFFPEYYDDIAAFSSISVFSFFKRQSSLAM